MAREYKIIAAVGKTDVPVPPALGLCTDVDVNGAPFYVMGYVDGRRDRQPGEGPAVLDPAMRAKASADLIDVLADLHAVDVDAIGLGDLARTRRVHRAPAQALDDAVGELQDPRAAGHRRGRRAPGHAHPRAAERRHRPRRLPLRQRPHRPRRRRASPASSTGSCARSATRSPTSATSACTGPIPGRRAGATTIRLGAGGVPHLRRRCSSATRPAPDATCRASTTTWRSRRGAWPSSARACTPATCTGRWATRASAPPSLDGMKLGTENLANAALEAVHRLG